jgi:zinc transporter ZupT
MSLSYSILISLIIFAMAIVAGIPSYAGSFRAFFDKYLMQLDAFSRGVFLSIGIIHLLPEALEHVHTPIIPLIVVLSFTFLMWLEKCLPHHINYAGTPFIMVIALSIHSMIEGFAVGIENDWQKAIALVVAIMAHKFIAAFALSIKLRVNTFLKSKQKFMYFVFFCLMTPLGIMLGLFSNSIINSFAIGSNIANAIAAGTFIYLGSMHEWHIKKDENHIAVFYFIVGIALMALVAFSVPHHHHHHH